MLTLLLVWTIALGSLAIFLAGMIFPELSRKNDLIWVGVGLFYALILWVYSGKIGGGLLLGQTAGVSMLVWLGWQTMTQRRELTPEDKKTPVPEWLQKIVDLLVPLWEKLTTALSNQLGLESAAGETGGEGSLGGIKTKVLDVLDRLNSKPGRSAPSTVDVTGAVVSDEQSVESEEDWEVEEETVQAAEKTAEVAPPPGEAVAVDSETAAESETVTTAMEDPPEIEGGSAESPEAGDAEPVQTEVSPTAQADGAEPPADATVIQSPEERVNVDIPEAPAPAEVEGVVHQEDPQAPDLETEDRADMVNHGGNTAGPAPETGDPGELETSNWPPDPVD
ncbi:Ycf66 family protein [Lyngbya confervoides]|uniref:Ycf66 family protein n=1 Tax=Lyngbya confervoides BDU141951 TaxID=1574623 RepID=A0ABD4T219_9CYAN|nr:Ycf66 family protein [Lyngbya confervoides]MCM1982579.1 hypothetical protein [Lyngbya confervoides BDU141951]